MVGDILQPTHLLFVLLVALVVLGPKRLPEVARTLGDGIRDFRAAISGERRDDEPPAVIGPHEDATQAAAPAAVSYEAAPVAATPEPLAPLEPPAAAAPAMPEPPAAMPQPPAAAPPERPAAATPEPLEPLQPPAPTAAAPPPHRGCARPHRG